MYKGMDAMKDTELIDEVKRRCGFFIPMRMGWDRGRAWQEWRAACYTALLNCPSADPAKEKKAWGL